MFNTFRNVAQQVPVRSLVPINISHSLFSQPYLRRFATESQVTKLIQLVTKESATEIAQMAKQNPSLIVEQTSNDNTALHEAAKRGNVNMIALLSKEFSQDFNVNHQCHCYLRRTPIHYATEGNHGDAVEMLLGMGADPNIQDEKKRTCLDYALEQGNEKLALMLYKHGAKANIETSKAQQLGPRYSAKIFAEKVQATQLLKSKETIEQSFKNFIAARHPNKKS